MNELYIYTDGSASNKTLCGGYAYVVLGLSHEIIGIGAKENTTNNRMELKAILEALENTDIFEMPRHVYTDSAYIHNCMAQKWYKNWEKNNWYNSKKEPVKNRDLWEKLIPYFNNPTITFHKVKGHADCELNNKVDKLAVERRKKLEKELML